MKTTMRTIVAAIVLALCAALASAQFGGGGPFGGGGYGNNGYGNNGYGGNDGGGGGGQRESLPSGHACFLLSDSTTACLEEVRLFASQESTALSNIPMYA